MALQSFEFAVKTFLRVVAIIFKFLKEIIPVAENSDVKMCIHPDDPPQPLFGIPRVVSTAEDLNQILKQVLNSNQKTILLVIYNSQNQKRYIGVKLD